MKRALWLASLLAILAGCVRSEAVRVIPESDLPSDVYARPSPSPPPGGERIFQIFFIKNGRVFPLERPTLETGVAVEIAIKLLLQGVTPQEQEADVTTAIPRNVQLLTVGVTEDTAVVDLAGEFEGQAEQQVLLQRLAQVVYTASALPGIQRVRFLINGEPREVLVGDGSVVGRAVDRSDYSSLAPP